MRTLPSLLCVSMVALLAACGTPDGYYDTNGHWVVSPNSADPSEHDITLRDRMRNEKRAHAADAAYERRIAYERRGYYDYDGVYLDGYEDDLNVPTNMFPARGMCRIWYVDRAPADQPRVTSCSRIRARVPVGAYVIYGG